MESSTYPDKKFIEASRNWVNVICHSEVGHEVDAVIGGKLVAVCKRYWNIPCSAHSDCYKQARSKYEGITGVPCTILASPDGKELERIGGGRAASEMAKSMEKVYAGIPGDKIGAVEWRQVALLLETGDKHIEKGEYKKANEAFTKISKMSKKALKEKGAEALEKLNKKGEELIEEAKGKLESEKDAAVKILKKVADEFKPLACSKAAAELLKAQAK